MMSLLTARRRFSWSSSTPRPHADALGRGDQLEPIADRIYHALVCRGIDVAPAEALARALCVPESVLCAGAARVPYLGLCGTGRELMVFCLPPEPIEAGFCAEYRDGRLMLRLPGQGRRPALLLSGRRVGPVPVEEREQTVGAGELAHLVSRLTLMARGWLPQVAASPMRVLFELIAAGWRSGPPPELRAGGELGVHRVDFTHPIGRGPVGPTHRLELVTHHHNGTHQLVNVYPGLGEASR